jgi:hypothetical protein
MWHGDCKLPLLQTESAKNKKGSRGGLPFGSNALGLSVCRDAGFHLCQSLGKQSFQFDQRS